MQFKDLSIVIVNFETYDLTRQTILSILNSNTPFDYEIIVVDNDSSDDSLEKLESDFQEYVTFIKAENNLGFAKANNLAIKEATGEHVLLLNSDTVLESDTVLKVMDFIRFDCECFGFHKEDIGAVGCKVLLENGELDKACRRSFPDVDVSFYRMSGLSKLFPKSERFNRYNMGYLSEDDTYEVDCLTGAFMLVPRHVIDEVGLLDESFFMYGEDIDWCYLIKQAGYKIIYYSGTSITHFKGGSSTNPKLIYEFYWAMQFFYDKHYKAQHNILVTGFIYTGIWLTYTIKRFLNIFRRK